MRKLIPLGLTYLFVPTAFAVPPGGAYLNAPAENAEVCARRCEEDGLCISWTFADQSCALAAIAPLSAPNGVAGGVSERAPGSFRIRNIDTSAKPGTPDVDAAATWDDKRPASAAASDSLELLGGPPSMQSTLPPATPLKG